ncbi:CoA pyrophosphatase [uncultured Microbacterium sp.]|uniref:NUDIX hydrolase n=1 Tax=uncultured Microbacterium sp. TaxID=191216 RepID=UPI0028D01E26|nr:CoA pyrophosphatase [uncultured Microbacterium sp.]
MPAHQPPQSARDELVGLADAVAAGRGGRGFEGFAALPDPTAPRTSAVLMLFGVLDGLPSDHAAHAHAVSRDLDVLLLERASTLRSHPGQVAFPGGRLDPEDDGPVAAALRESVEETGLDASGVEVLGALETVPLAFSQNLVIPVLAWWRHPSPVRVVDVAESAAVFRAPVADLLDPAKRGVTVIRRGGQEWRGPGFLVPRLDGRGKRDGDHLVWGFTAMLLDGLFDRLGWTEPWDSGRELPLVLPEVDAR